MNICFPVSTNSGLENTIYGHFASAPFFMLVDTNTGLSSFVPNCDSKTPFAGCNPFSALRSQQLDGIITGGIGDASVELMNLCGFKVYKACSDSVPENIALFTDGKLPEIEVQQSQLEGRCSSGESGATCNHHDH